MHFCGWHSFQHCVVHTLSVRDPICYLLKHGLVIWKEIIVEVVLVKTLHAMHMVNTQWEFRARTVGMNAVVLCQEMKHAIEVVV